MRKQIYNYTSNLELTSLLIRVKNYKLGLNLDNSLKLNNFINKRISLYSRINEKSYGTGSFSKKQKVLNKLKTQITTLSEKCVSDKIAYNRFGEVILTMIRHILTKPQFSGYTYRDDFFSDAIYKILKYIDNFDHTLISKHTGQRVNAFSYITQIIHMSILFVINSRKMERDNIINHAKLNINESILHSNMLIVEKDRSLPPEKIEKTVYLRSNKPEDVLTEFKGYLKSLDNVKVLNVHFLKDIVFTADQFKELRELKDEYKIINYANRY